ncbi:MAG: 23S rRNA (uracil-5-)-methyltransferase RumA, partial [Eubacteriales bacterium]
FIQGAAETLMPQLADEGYRPDIIVLDPPRKGAAPEVLAAIAEASPEKIVYVSCNPATQARDAKILREAGYRASACQSVDMFCATPDVENILLFERAIL